MQLGPIQQEFVRCLKEDNIPQTRTFYLFERVRGETVCRHSVLGVLIMTCIANGYSFKKTAWRNRVSHWEFGYCFGVLPSRIAHFVGLSSAGMLKLNAFKGSGTSFPEAAKVIEESPEEFFCKSV